MFCLDTGNVAFKRLNEKNLSLFGSNLGKGSGHFVAFELRAGIFRN